MLVQLRRVVYLLVLLQCCLSVCLANEGKSHDPEAHVSITLAESRLKKAIHRADELIAKRTVCMEKGIESMNDYKKKYKNATDTKNVIEAHVEEMKKFTDSAAKEGDAVNVTAKLEELDKRLLAAKPFMVTAGEAVRDAMTSYAWAKYVRDTCGGLSGSMEKEEEHLREAVGGYRGFFPRVTKTEEMEQLAEEGVKVKKALAEEKEKIKKYDESNVKKNLNDGQDLKEMGKAVIKARAYLLAYSGVITEVNFESTHHVKKEPFEKKIEKVEQNVTEETKIAEEHYDAKMKERINKVPEEKKGIMLNEIKERVARQVEERKKEENAKPEQEKPGENSDNSNSPALVHSPLLILLSCVLGSILVC